MEPFNQLTSRIIPLPIDNVDTDQIIPAKYLKVTDKAGLAEGLFAGWRFLPEGKPNPEFPLNQDQFFGAQILLAGDNFGCGSSREHAPWALKSWGIRAVISTSFADIFYNNSLKNSLLPVVVDSQFHRNLFEQVEVDPGIQATINLTDQSLVLPDGNRVIFPIDAFNKHCMLQGVDQLGFILQHESQIAEYERSHGLD